MSSKKTFLSGLVIKLENLLVLKGLAEISAQTDGFKKVADRSHFGSTI